MQYLWTILVMTTLIFTGEPSKVEWLCEETHDFGDILHQDEVTYTFEFKNVSGEPFVVDNVRTSCGCTVSDWGLEPILPDSIGQISVTYDAHDPGYFNKWIKVYFSGQRKAERRFIEGYVVP